MSPNGSFRRMLRWRHLLTPVDPQLAAIAALITAVLQEPEQVALDVARSARDENQRSADLWRCLASCSSAEASLLADQVVAPQIEQIAEFINTSRRGIVVTTIHTSGYLLGLLQLSTTIAGTKPVIIVRKKQATPLEEKVFAHFDRGDCRFQVIRHEEKRSLRLIRALRLGAIVVALHDLPSSYGRTRCVSFLDQAMHLVSGPADLAQMSGADIVPMYCARDVGAPAAAAVKTTFHAPIRATVSSQACERLAAMATQHIRAYPGQWLHWHHIPAFLSPPIDHAA